MKCQIAGITTEQVSGALAHLGEGGKDGGRERGREGGREE